MSHDVDPFPRTDRKIVVLFSESKICGKSKGNARLLELLEQESRPTSPVKSDQSWKVPCLWKYQFKQNGAAPITYSAFNTGVG